MRKILLSAIILGLFVCNAKAQEQEHNTVSKVTAEKKEPKPGLKDEELPSFKILDADSVTYFNISDVRKGRSSVIIFFDPTCSHCINFLEKLFPAMDSFKKVNFYLVSAVHDVSKLRKFKADYHTDDYKNIKVVGRDVEMFFISHYGLQRFPGAAVYDKHNKFVNFYESDDVKVDTLYERTH